MHSEIVSIHYFSNVYKLLVKFHYLKKLIYITEIVNAHYFGVHVHYFGSDLLLTTTIVKFGIGYCFNKVRMCNVCVCVCVCVCVQRGN